MKLILVTVVAFIVFTADGWDFRNEPEEQQPSTDEAVVKPSVVENHGEENIQDEPEIQASQDQLFANVKHQMEESQHERKANKSSCKAKTTCVLMGGFCVTNTTLCTGRLVAGGCKPKGSNCTCCVPGTLETKLQNLTMELQQMKHNITDELLNQEIKLDSIKTNQNNMTDELLNQETKLDFIKTNQDNMTDELLSQETKLDLIKKHQDEACYSPGFSCAFGAGTCRPDSCNATTENQNGTCGGVGCKCCTKKFCYSPGSSCASGQGACRPNSCNSTTEDQSGTCGGASCKCCKIKSCYSPGSKCASGQGICRVSSCLSTEYQNGTCGGASCKCCKSNCHSLGSSCASGRGTCRANSCSTNEYQYDTCGGTNCKCCKSCSVSRGEFQIGRQCFKMYTGIRTWASARSYCTSYGLDLAQPEHPSLLHKYFRQKGWTSYRTWIGARGTGSCYRWLNGTCISQTSPLWVWGPDGDKGTSWAVNIYNPGSNSNKPIDAHASSTSYYVLCERK